MFFLVISPRLSLPFCVDNSWTFPDFIIASPLVLNSLPHEISPAREQNRSSAFRNQFFSSFWNKTPFPRSRKQYFSSFGHKPSVPCSRERFPPCFSSSKSSFLRSFSFPGARLSSKPLFLRSFSLSSNFPYTGTLQLMPYVRKEKPTNDKRDDTGHLFCFVVP